MPGQPSVTLSFDPPGPQFAISDQGVMPSITVTAALQNSAFLPNSPLQYKWKITLIFNRVDCPHSMGRVVKHPDIARATTTNTLLIPFSAVRGGALNVSVTVIGAGSGAVSGQSPEMQVVGTNPTLGGLHAATVGASDRFKKLIRLESSLRQFRSPTCPLFSADGMGGVGLCQLTKPSPTDDQIWDWNENLAGGLALWESKKKIAKGYPEAVRNSASFKALVSAYNAQRAALPPNNMGPVPLTSLPVTIPDYDEEQLERDTLRGFNGYAGQLHEYRPKVDPNGMLVVTVDASSNTGKAEWERLTAAMRVAIYDQLGLSTKHRGDPNYVDDVESKASF